MTLLARKALADYLLTVHKIPEYIDALNASDPVALIVSELDRIEAATEWHTDGIFGLHQPARRPDGEGLDGHHKPGPDWQPGSKAVDTYVFVRSGATHCAPIVGSGCRPRYTQTAPATCGSASATTAPPTRRRRQRRRGRSGSLVAPFPRTPRRTGDLGTWDAPLRLGSVRDRRRKHRDQDRGQRPRPLGALLVTGASGSCHGAVTSTLRTTGRL